MVLDDAGNTFVEGREARVAGGLIVIASATLTGMVAAVGVVLGVLAGLEAIARGFPTADSAVASAALADPADDAGDVGPVVVAPEVAPALPASGAATRSPRVEDGPPEGIVGER